MKPTVRNIQSQDSWILATENVELAVTQLGGHMAPVFFYRDTDRPIQPYHISPWQGEASKIGEPVLVPLRGDFFCAPFGADNEYRGEKHVAHGESATRKWSGASVETQGQVHRLTMQMKTKARPGRINKTLSLIPGHNAVYAQHVLEDFSGKMCLGHHATLAAGDEERSLAVSTSPFAIGRTFPDLYSNPANREYQALAIDAGFRSLTRVPTRFKRPASIDASRFPHLLGYDDQIALFKKPSSKPAWITAVAAGQGYLWYAFKDPSVLPATVFWMSNRGRHGPPWRGRNLCLGLEDVCGYFAAGLKPSAAENPIQREGIPTTISLSKSKPTVIRTIQGVVKIPSGFVKVRSVRFDREQVTFRCVSGKTVSAAVCIGFLNNGL